MMRVVAYTKYDREAASTRQRFLQFIPALRAAGIALDHQPLLPDEYVRNVGTGQRFSRLSLLRRYAGRARNLFFGQRPDAIWIHAELFPYMPSLVERLVFRSGTPVIYDWDDAVFVPYSHHARPLVRRVLGRKFEGLLARAAATTCGNAFLRDYCAQFCPTNLVVPTTVDIDVYKPRKYRQSDGAPLTIGWIGSPTTWLNVRPLLPLLERFCTEHNARFRAVGAGARAERDRFAQLELVDWNEAAEVEEVQGFDIGIMPLLDGPFERGKCGYKLIQYMACGAASIATPIGVNCEIVREGETGLLASSEAEWQHALTQLAADPALRRRMGEAGRAQVVAQYSMQSQAPRLIELFRSLEIRRDD